MKLAAKQVLKSTAEKNGIPWDSTVQQLQNTPEVPFFVPICTQVISLLRQQAFRLLSPQSQDSTLPNRQCTLLLFVEVQSL